MSFCKNCGTKLGEGVKFCAKCGTPLGAGTHPVQTQAAAQTQTPALPQHIPSAERKATPAGLKTVQILSIIGIVLYCIGLITSDTVSYVFVVIGLYFALAHAIVSLVQGGRHQIAVLKVMGIIGIVWLPFGWLFEIFGIRNGTYVLGIIYPLAFAVTALVTANRALKRLQPAAQQAAPQTGGPAQAYNTAMGAPATGAPLFQKKQAILAAIIGGLCIVAAASFIVVKVTTGSSGGLPANPLYNTTWTTGNKGIGFGGLGYESSESLEFSRSGYIREETSNLSFWLEFSNKETKDKGSYIVDGDTVIFTPSSGNEYIGELIGNTLIVGDVTFKRQ